MDKPLGELENLEPVEIDIDEFMELSKEVISKNAIGWHLVTNFESMMND